MKIKRAILNHLLEQLDKDPKGIVIYGPRQAGKTTLVQDILVVKNYKVFSLNADTHGEWEDLLKSRNVEKIKLLISGYDVLFIDEAQRIPEIGLILKIILDSFNIRVIVTGSSSLDLASKISEPLTGRVYSYKLLPISQKELSEYQTPYESRSQLEERLVFGSYPKIFSLAQLDEKVEFLRNLTDAYLYKDLLEFGDIRNSSKIRDLLKLLAFQLGNEVSIAELATSLEISRDSVNRYIDLLEKSFVIFRLSGFSKNLRKEVTKMDKIYFYDTGVRNTLINNLNLLSQRNDGAKLFENYLIVERMKKLLYEGSLFSHYFWRLTSGAEIDLIEENEGKIIGFEFKYSQKVVRPPQSFTQNYPNNQFQTINKDNYMEFIK